MIIKKKPTIKDIIDILNKEKKIEKIVCSKGAYTHFPKKALSAIRKMGIKIEIVDLKRGRKAKTDIKKIKSLSHLPAKEISAKTRIPLRTIYYHLRKMRKKNA